MLPYIALVERANQPFVALHCRQPAKSPSCHEILCFLEGIQRTHTGRIWCHPIRDLHFLLLHRRSCFLANLLPGAITLVLPEVSRLDTVGLKCALEIGSIGYIAHGN